MSRRSLLSTKARKTFFEIPTDVDDLVQHYLAPSEGL